MSAPRGFRYALDPVLRRQRWELEARQRELADACRALEETEDRRRGLERRYADGAREQEAALATGFDLARHRRMLAWLAGLRTDILAAVAACDAARERVAALRSACARLQRRLEVLERHRDEAAQAFAHEEARRAGVELDREWLARRMWRAGMEETA